MKAAVIRGVGEPLTIEDVTLAEPGPNEVLIRVAAAGLCHSDVRHMTGDYATDFPTVLGHESAGVVEATGERVTHVAPGDHVITSLSVFCGVCSNCRDGRSNLCEDRDVTRRGAHEPPRLSMNGEALYQFLDLSSFAEQMLVHEHAVVKVKSEIPFEHAALIGCGVATGLGAVLNTAKVRPGNTVVVIGCGGVGLSAVQGARIAGATMIAAVDRVAHKLEIAAGVGATHTIDAASDDPVNAVMKLTGGRGVDHAFEAIGSTTTAEQAFAMLRRGGTATLIGLIPEGQHIRLPGDAFIDEKRIQGSNMGSNRFRVDLPRYVDMYLDGRLRLGEMVTERLDLAEINEGFDRMRTGRVARNVIMFR